MIPDDRHYTKDHEWLKEEGGLSVVGVTEPLLRKLSPVISVELPEPDDEMKNELPFAELEGGQENWRFYPPAEARVIEVNDPLTWDQRPLEKDPYGAGWLMKIRVDDEDELRLLMNANTYRIFCLETLGEEYIDDR
jgi:glycine cleavage system H protein